MMLVDQIQHIGARRCDDGPEGDARRLTRLNPYTASKHKNGIKDGSDSIGERSAIHHRDRRPSIAPTTEETSSIGLDLRLAHRLTFDDGKMGRPDLRFGWRPAAPRR
jgi:hypothetical protein